MGTVKLVQACKNDDDDGDDDDVKMMMLKMMMMIDRQVGNKLSTSTFVF